MSAHTPGPWQVLPEEVDRPYIRIRGTRPGDRYKIANVLTPVHEAVAHIEADVTRANARLIAAAPDMFDALQDALASLEISGQSDYVTGRVRAAIIKARGAV